MYDCTVDRLRSQWRTRELFRHGVDRHVRVTAFSGGVLTICCGVDEAAGVRERTRRKRRCPGWGSRVAEVRGPRRRVVFVRCGERRCPRRAYRKVRIATYFAGGRAVRGDSPGKPRSAGRTTSRDAQRRGG